MGIITLPLDAVLSSTEHELFSQRRALLDVSTAVAKSKRAVVISGAGISCSSGIPVSFECLSCTREV
jgi:NAD-dependent histone deacetylase SIR2